MNKYRFPILKDVEKEVFIQFCENSTRTEQLHTHPFLQIVFVLSGKMTHQIGGISADLTGGEMAIIPSNVMHSVSLNANTSYYALSFLLSSLGEINELNEHIILFLRSLETSAIPIFPKTTLADNDIRFMESIFAQIDAEIARKETGYFQNVTAYIILLVNRFIRRYYKQTPSAQEELYYTGKQMVLNAIKYIDAHISDPLSLSETASIFNVSVSIFCRYFNQLTGKSFKEYLKCKRIAYANELIKKGYSIAAAASLCGFGDFSTFSRSYKQVMGITPSEYRKVHRVE
ncbi:MAG: helix-turn-helix domain-containing protein [Oscillospiraceae bacterium]|nr:helix-turn-helix domain-containing protein [Oscillospiraceae bacterium]